MAQKPTKKVRKRKKRVVGVDGKAFIKATFNNTLVTITETNGDVVANGSCGAEGFKGARKSTPFAAQVAAGNCGEKAQAFGIVANGRLVCLYTFQTDLGDGWEDAPRPQSTRVLRAELTIRAIQVSRLHCVLALKISVCRRSRQSSSYPVLCSFYCAYSAIRFDFLPFKLRLN